MELQLSFSLITSSFILLFFALKLLIKLPKRSHQKLPPGPWKLPVIGNVLHLAGSLPHRGLRDLAKKHGPLMHLQLGQISAIVVSSPRMATEILKTHDLAFADRPQLLASQIILYDGMDIGFSPYGPYWKQMRKICASELLSPKKVCSFRYVREEEVGFVIESIRSSSSSSSSSGSVPINLTKEIFSLVNSMVCRALIGSRCKDQESLINMIHELISSAGGFDVADLFPSFKWLHFLSGTRPKLERLHHRVDNLLANIIIERVMNKNRTDAVDYEEDLLDVLLRLKDSHGLDVPITSDNVKAIILDMFSGAIDSSSATIEWAMTEMIKSPRVMEKAQAEIRGALKGKKVVEESDIQELSYLKMVIKETLRLHPVAPLLLPRECREECEINGYKIPLKTKVIVNAWAIGRDPEYWDDAENFKPERFMNSPIEHVGPNLEYIPFGAGRRICPGMLFGLADVELPLAQFIYHFNWKLPGDINPQDVDMSEIFGAGVRKRNNLYLIATPNI